MKRMPCKSIITTKNGISDSAVKNDTLIKSNKVETTSAQIISMV